MSKRENSLSEMYEKRSCPFDMEIIQLQKLKESDKMRERENSLLSEIQMNEIMRPC